MGSETDAMRSRAKHEAIDRYTHPANRQAFIAGADFALRQREPVAWRVRYKRAPDYWIIFMHYPTDAVQDPEREVFPLYSGAEPIGRSES